VSQQINLFNPIFLKQKKYFSAVTMAQALGLIFVGSAALSAYTGYRLTALSKEAEATSARLAAVQAQSSQVNSQYAPKQKAKSLEEDIRKSESEIKSLQHILAVLQKGEFGNTDGYAEYMRAFSRQIMSGVWLTGFGIYGAGTDILLQGRALKPDLVPAYITRLKREPALQGKSFAALEMQALQAGQPAKPDAAAGQQRAMAAYIDFSLRSSDAIKEQQPQKNAKADPFPTANAYLETVRALNAAKDLADLSGAKAK
jgi:hypothetical protein